MIRLQIWGILIYFFLLYYISYSYPFTFKYNKYVMGLEKIKNLKEKI